MGLKLETSIHCQAVLSCSLKIILWAKMGKFSLLLWVLLAVTSSAFAQGYRQQSTLYNRGRDSSSSSCRGACPCTQEYIPFCATDGRQETTYGNKCQLECAQRCNPSLRIRFEGVCARPYVHGGSGKAAWDSTSSASKNPPFVVVPPPTTRRPQPTTRPSYSGYQTRPTTRPPFSGYQTLPTIRPPFSGYQTLPTIRPPYSGYQTRPTTRPPYFGFQPSTSRPSYGSSGYQPVTTTVKPWWQSDVARTRYPPDSSSNGIPAVDWRKSRDVGDNQLYEEDDYNGEK